MARIQMTTEDMKTIYDVSKDIYDKKISRMEGLSKLASINGTESSKEMYFQIFSSMRNGTCYKMGTSAPFTKFMIEEIYSDFGLDGVKNAIQAAKLNCEYRKYVGNAQPGIETVCRDAILEKKLPIKYESLATYRVDITEVKKTAENNENTCINIDFSVYSSDLFSNKIGKRYTTSLLSKPFTILAGNSGTGKTKIAKDLATWLGKKDENTGTIANKLIVPVGSDWTDNTKILGFYNPLKKTYESTKILDFILLARDNPEIPFFLILDEMNLSHVERYFSDFLSAMESHEKIILYSKDEDCESAIPESIDLPENLFVTGTVNIDETTYMFSPKVLDRANVIEFIPEQSDVLANFADETQPDEITPVNDGSAEGFLALAKSVRETTTLPKDSYVCKTILEGISNILAGSGFEFAFRTAKEIRLYINAAYALAQNEGKTLSEDDYVNLMDEQLLQKILPKVHGNRSQVGLLLKNLQDFCDSKTVKYNDKDIQGYNLKNSKEKIARMLKQLETSQFTSFI